MRMIAYQFGQTTCTATLIGWAEWDDDASGKNNPMADAWAELIVSCRSFRLQVGAKVGGVARSGGDPGQMSCKTQMSGLRLGHGSSSGGHPGCCPKKSSRSKAHKASLACRDRRGYRSRHQLALRCCRARAYPHEVGVPGRDDEIASVTYRPLHTPNGLCCHDRLIRDWRWMPLLAAGPRQHERPAT